MIAFFFTMPISRIMPIIAMTLRSTLKSSSATIAPTPAEGSVDRIVSGWIKLSYKNAEHDIHRHQRQQDQVAAPTKATA